MPTRLQRNIGNTSADLASLIAAVQLFAGDNQLGPQAVYTLELAIEELITNTIKYGYDDNASHQILVQIDVSPERVILAIEDDGHAFNPLEHAAPDTGKPPEEREIGGLGLHMVREMSEKMEYRREGGRNITAVHIRL